MNNINKLIRANALHSELETLRQVKEEISSGNVILKKVAIRLPEDVVAEAGKVLIVSLDQKIKALELEFGKLFTGNHS